MRTAAAPMPRDPPVMSAALPASEIMTTPEEKTYPQMNADYTDRKPKNENREKRKPGKITTGSR
jgi:hypothetical protein